MDAGRLRMIAAGVLAVLVGAVLWQNLGPAHLALLFWRVQAPLAVWIAGAFALGFAAGWLARHRRRA